MHPNAQRSVLWIKTKPRSNTIVILVGKEREHPETSVRKLWKKLHNYKLKLICCVPVTRWLPFKNFWWNILCSSNERIFPPPVVIRALVVCNDSKFSSWSFLCLTCTTNVLPKTMSAHSLFWGLQICSPFLSIILVEPKSVICMCISSLKSMFSGFKSLRIWTSKNCISMIFHFKWILCKIPPSKFLACFGQIPTCVLFFCCASVQVPKRFPLHRTWCICCRSNRVCWCNPTTRLCERNWDQNLTTVKNSNGLTSCLAQDFCAFLVLFIP